LRAPCPVGASRPLSRTPLRMAPAGMKRASCGGVAVGALSSGAGALTTRISSGRAGGRGAPDAGGTGGVNNWSRGSSARGGAIGATGGGGVGVGSLIRAAGGGVGGARCLAAVT
jgi:hypothetical protein